MVPGVSKDELYLRAREWFARTFVSAQALIQMDDKAAGKIIGKGLSEDVRNGFIRTAYTIYYTVSITVKEGRYRYEITDFYREIIRGTGASTVIDQKTAIDELINNPKNIGTDGEYKGRLKEVTLITNTIAPKFP
jgi:hypothetical protein